jgi:hypothetical protein
MLRDEGVGIALGRGFLVHCPEQSCEGRDADEQARGGDDELDEREAREGMDVSGGDGGDEQGRDDPGKRQVSVAPRGHHDHGHGREERDEVHEHVVGVAARPEPPRCEPERPSALPDGDERQDDPDPADDEHESPRRRQLARARLRAHRPDFERLRRRWQLH